MPDDDLAAAVKPEHGDAAGAPSGAPRKKAPPDWGRAGPRANKGARWSELEGQIGELCVHKSGKVSMMINGDLHYDVRPSVPLNISRSLTHTPLVFVSEFRQKQVLPAAQPSFLQEIVILDHDPATEPRRPGSDSPASDPNRAMLMMGQTSKKFLVVPEVTHLLEKVALQDKEERAEELRRKVLKKEGKA